MNCNKLPHYAYTAQQVRAYEQQLFEKNILKSSELIQQAGQAIFTIIQRYFQKQPLVVVCGKGNNGADGWVVARLAVLAGIDVIAIDMAPEKKSQDCLQAYQHYVQIKGKVSKFLPKYFTAEKIIIDALLGTGFQGKLKFELDDVIKQINKLPKQAMVSVDIPSGLQGDSGEVYTAIQADHTITLVGLKTGLLTGKALNYVGELHYCDLELSIEGENPHRLYRSFDDFPSVPRRLPAAHKGDCGHIVLIGGQQGMPGAIRLAAEACLRVGAGTTTVITHKKNCLAINSVRAEIMTIGISSQLTTNEKREIQESLERATAVVIGPGLGKEKWGRALLALVLKRKQLPKIIDADALNLLVPLERSLAHSVITPHPKEAARLLSTGTQNIEANRYQAIEKLQQISQGVVVLKGAGTLVKSITPEITIHRCGDPGMATAGMGDLLTGIIAGLIGQGVEMTLATNLAVFIHGKAGELAANEGQYGLIASDLLPFIRQLRDKISQ